MSDIVIRVENVSKRYRIVGKRARYKTLRDSLARSVTFPFRRLDNQSLPNTDTGLEDTFWALNDISLNVNRGEIVGVIGRNGAGKSTLLKILSRITDPTTGRAEIRGRVGSLLEVGTGFHPELTGRENVYLNGAILGMKRAEIDGTFDQIVAFAEVEKFIDTPVKHYSSGMQMRLAFAVAAHLQTEILLVDEVLAVGDQVFQAKCMGRMGEVAQEGRTILFVSHNLGSITRLCERVVWLHNGRLALDDLPSDVVSAYLASATQECPVWNNEHVNGASAPVHITGARLLDRDDKPGSAVRFDESLTVEIAYWLSVPVHRMAVLCRLSDLQGNILWTTWDTDTTDLGRGVREPGAYLSTCTFPTSIIRPGRYHVSVGIHGSPAIQKLSYHENILSFDVSAAGYPLNSGRVGIITPLLEWNVRRIGDADQDQGESLRRVNDE